MKLLPEAQYVSVVEQQDKQVAKLMQAFGITPKTNEQLQQEQREARKAEALREEERILFRNTFRTRSSIG